MFSINLRILQVIFTYLINLNNSNFYPSLYKYWVIKFGSPNFDRKISVKLNPMHQNIRKIIIIIIIFHLYKIYKRNDEKIIILQVTILHKIQLYPLERGLKTKRNYPRQSVHGSTSRYLAIYNCSKSSCASTRFVTYTEPRSYVNVQNFAQRGCWPAHFRMTLLRKRYLLSTPRALSNWLHASFHAFYSTNRLSFHLDIDCAYQRVNPTDSQWSPSMNRVIHRSRHLSCVNQRRTSASDRATSNIPFLFALKWKEKNIHDRLIDKIPLVSGRNAR